MEDELFVSPADSTYQSQAKNKSKDDLSHSLNEKMDENQMVDSIHQVYILFNKKLQ